MKKRTKIILAIASVPVGLPLLFFAAYQWFRWSIWWSETVGRATENL